ncbi:DUF1801 domain-containing protein [Alkalicoccus halolimnae]|uniref:DUF1801 domain-containing protein n=1 Tax=Alkalicoccus halolimnae TaxID=1667239 RepID=A0A5C7F283_9BACI|nr:DUF1801 domain-containing protein [Alkalicoccus halolimnae]TXF83989.1 DUF1801 domain-containing protein [Alkalicoccus halolimnae]
MGYELKTKENEEDVTSFLNKLEKESKRKDAFRLLEIFQEETGEEPKMWGESMIGFGTYHYKYKTGHEGDWFIAGFSPRKANFSLYLAQTEPKREARLEKLGKHKSGKSCVYINKLADIDEQVLREMISETVLFLKK